MSLLDELKDCSAALNKQSATMGLPHFVKCAVPPQ